MKLTMTILRRPAVLAGLVLVLSAPAAGISAERFAAQTRPQAPLGTPIQQANYNCPNGDCYQGGGWGGGGWGWRGGCAHGGCYGGGGLFGCGCHHGLAAGNAWVRPPAAWGLSRTPNTYRYYWNSQLAGVPSVGGGPYPMVYQPTDTTQMGFYYQAVPRWQYRPEMLPQAPAPNWPLGMNSAVGTYNTGYVAGTVNTTPAVNAQPVPVTPANPPAPAVAPPPPAEPAVNVPEAEAAVFPNRRRR